MSSGLDKCPKCGVSWIGDPIPEKHHKYYSPPYFWKREIAIYDTFKDRTVEWQCPDCKTRFNRDPLKIR